MSELALAPATRAAVRAAVLAGGAVLMALEILAFRVIDKTFGSALRETSVVISVFLAAMSLGYFLGGRWGDRWPRVRTLAAVLAAAGVCALAIPRLDAALAPRVFASSLPLALHSAVVTTALFALPTLLLATVSPIAVRLLAARVERSGSVAGGVAALSTVGSILGAVAAAFVLIDLFESVHRTIVALALAALALAALLAAARLADAGALGGRPAAWLARRRFAAAVALLAAAGGAAWGALGWARRPGPPVETILEAGTRPGYRLGEVVFERDSPFHHVTVVDRGRTRSLYFKHAEVQSTMSLDDPYEGAAEYTDYFHLPMLLAAEARRVLFVGLGGGSAPKRFVRDYPQVTVDAVELDPLVVEVARRYFGVEPGPRLRIATADGRAFVKRSRATWDVVGIDAYTTNAYGSTLPAHLVTREFFEELSERMAPEGWLAMNVAAPPHSPIARAIGRTLLAVFPRQLVFHGGTGNTLFLASKSERHVKREELVALASEGLASGRIRMPALALRAGRMLTSSLPLGDAPLLTDDYAPVDRLMRQSRGFNAPPEIR